MTENEVAAIIRETTCTQCPYGYYRGKMKSCGNYECEKRKVVLEALKALESMEELWKYRAIGTVEECLRNKDFLDFLSDKMNPNDFEVYLRIYNSQDVKGCDGE